MSTNDDFQVSDMGDEPEGISVRYHAEESRWIAKGACPRCGHNTDRVYTITAITAAADDGIAVDGEALEKHGLATMRCTCTSPHDDRPDDEDGCGAYWRVRLRADAGE